MNPAQSTLARGTLASALVLGLAGNALLRVAPWGANLALWTALGAGTAAALSYRERLTLPNATWGWMLLALACGILPVWRGSEPLAGMTYAAGAAALALAAWSSHGGSAFLAGVTDAFGRMVLTLIQSFLGGFYCLASLRQDTAGTDPQSRSSAGCVPPRTVGRVLVGLLLAVPLLVVFGSLFLSADLVFRQWIGRFSFPSPVTLFQHALATFFWGWIAAGYLNHLLTRDHAVSPPRLSPAPPSRTYDIEVHVALGALAVLFLAFLSVQVRYLFGNHSLVQQTVGVTYAEYARHGFFELVAVAVLLLPVLLGADWLLRGDTRRKGFQILAGALLAMLVVILASALRRMTLYREAYGWTELRLFTTAFMVWLMAVSAWFALTVLPGRRPRFAGGAIVAGYALMVGLHVLNPGAFIARSNLARIPTAETPTDVSYLTQLGADAVPILVEHLPSMPPDQAAIVRRQLLRRWEKPGNDWRTWNFSRALAHDAVRSLGIPADAPSGSTNGQR